MTTGKGIEETVADYGFLNKPSGGPANAPQWAYPNTDISSSNSRKVLSKTGGENPQDKSPPP